MSAPTIDPAPAAEQTRRTGLAKWIRRLSIPIIVGWIAVVALLNVTVPQLEVVGQMRSVSMSPKEAPSVIAMMRTGEVFEEFESDSSAMIVLEGEQPLGDDAHRFYNEMVDRLEADTKHVEHVQDFWGDPLTEAGAQSNDGKAAYVQVYLAGNQGETLANESVQAVQELIAGFPPPPGVKVFVTGSSALAADQQIAGDRSVQIIEIVTFVVIISMLLLVYRSFVTVLIVLVMVFLGLSAARGMVAFLGYHELIGLSTFATNLLVTLAIAAATDYAIFLVGRYQEARTIGEDRESAFYTMFRGTAHVVLGSGMTIAGATFCLSFTRLPYFQSLGVPLAVGMVVAVFVALTLGPAVITVASRFGLLEPKRAMRIRGWRRLGAAIVRWPGPILLATVALSLVGLLTLPGYRPNYNDRNYLPADLPANEGYAAAERHFPAARMNPEMLLIESDHDLRNAADFLVIDKIAKAVFRVPGIGRVQAITRPSGKPIEFSTIPAQLSLSGSMQTMNRKYMQDLTANMLVQADEMQTSINTMTTMIGLMEQMSATTHSMVGKTADMAVDIAELRDHIADFDDFVRPFRNYLYWEPHCYNIPVCWSMRSLFDSLDGIDTMTDQFQTLVPDLQQLDSLMPQLVALLPENIETMKTMRTMMLSMQSTQAGMQDQRAAMSENQSAMGDAFNDAWNDDTFYLPPDIFENEEFNRGMESFISPNGHAVRFIINHEGDPLSADGIERIDAHQARRERSHQGHASRGIQNLRRGHRVGIQGHGRGQQLGLADCRNRRTGADIHHHAAHHAQSRRSGRHCRHRGALARRVVWPVGVGLAARARHRSALHDDGDGGHHLVGRRRGLQPVVGGSPQGGDPRRHQHRDHPSHGWHRVGRDRRRPGVRVHHDVDVGRRADHRRPDRQHDRTGSSVRHLGDSGVYDTVHCGAAW